MNAIFLALGMFSVLPAPTVDAERRTAATAVRWLPAVGALLGVLASGVALVFWRGHGAGAPALGATAAVLTLALLSRGLHLDGLADLADGLGSRRAAAEALEIMRRSDIGPFGVAAVVGCLLLQITATAAVLGVASRPQAIVVLAAVAAGGRLAALDAARPAVPAARPGGFGALVAGSATTGWRAGILAVVLLSSWALLLPTSTALRALWLPAAVAAGLVVARAVTAHARRRLGGVTGDVFGALVEISTTVALLVAGATAAWRGAM